MVSERRDEEYTARPQMEVYGKRGDAKENTEFQKIFNNNDLYKGYKRFFFWQTVGGVFLMLDKNLD